MTHVANIKLTFDIMQTCQPQKTQTGRSIKKSAEKQGEIMQNGEIVHNGSYTDMPKIK